MDPRDRLEQHAVGALQQEQVVSSSGGRGITVTSITDEAAMLSTARRVVSSLATGSNIGRHVPNHIQSSSDDMAAVLSGIHQTRTHSLSAAALTINTNHHAAPQSIPSGAGANSRGLLNGGALDPRKREERNAREKERSCRIAQQIDDLRGLLSRGGVIVAKGTKSSVLQEAANYIEVLQRQQYQWEM